MDIIQNKTQKSTITKSTKDTEIESLDKKKRKESRQIANKTIRYKMEYAELNKLMKKKRRTRGKERN